MAFTDSWVETDPDGAVIFVSQLDDSIRVAKKAIRERLEGNPSDPDLTGLIEVGSWPLAPKPRKGAARVYVDTGANILAYGTTKREDGRLAFGSDTKKLYHVATAGVEELGYLSIVSGGTVASGNIVITAGNLNITSGNINITAGSIFVPAGGITVAGNSAFGVVTAVPYFGVNLGGAYLSGSSDQRGLVVDITPSNEATDIFMGISANGRSAAAAYTVAIVAGIVIHNTVKGAGSTISDNRGLYIKSQTVGTVNYAIYTESGQVRLGDQTTVQKAGVTPFIVDRPEAAGTLPLISLQRSGVERGSIGLGSGDQPLFRNATSGGALTFSDLDITLLQLAKPTNSGNGVSSIQTYDSSDLTTKQVSYGVNDSGGAGFKVLRVPN